MDDFADMGRPWWYQDESDYLRPEEIDMARGIPNDVVDLETPSAEVLADVGPDVAVDADDVIDLTDVPGETADTTDPVAVVEDVPETRYPVEFLEARREALLRALGLVNGEEV